MANYKCLGQSNPAATTWTPLYTCAIASGAIASSLIMTNRGASAVTVRVVHRPLGAALANGQYIAYDLVLQAAGTGQNSAYLTLGLGIANTDVIAVYASANTVDFVLEGVEAP